MLAKIHFPEPKVVLRVEKEDEILNPALLPSFLPTKSGFSTVARTSTGGIALAAVVQSPNYRWKIRATQIKCKTVSCVLKGAYLSPSKRLRESRLIRIPNPESSYVALQGIDNFSSSCFHSTSTKVPILVYRVSHPIIREISS